MGNKFEILASQFSNSERYSVQIPAALIRVVSDTLKTPYKIYNSIKEALKEPELLYTYILNKTNFSKILAKHFGVDAESSESSGIFKLFRVSTVTAQGENQVVNVLEFMTAIILLAQLGESSPSDLVHNSELVEHKINLMLLLFDFRQ